VEEHSDNDTQKEKGRLGRRINKPLYIILLPSPEKKSHSSGAKTWSDTSGKRHGLDIGLKKREELHLTAIVIRA